MHYSRDIPRLHLIASASFLSQPLPVGTIKKRTGGDFHRHASYPSCLLSILVSLMFSRGHLRNTRPSRILKERFFEICNSYWTRMSFKLRCAPFTLCTVRTEDCLSLLMHQQHSLLTHDLNLASLMALDSHEASPASNECSRSVTHSEDSFIRRKWKSSIRFRSETVSIVLTQQWWNSHSQDNVATASAMFMWHSWVQNREEVQHTANFIVFGTMSRKGPVRETL